MTLTLYHFPASVCSQRVRLVLAELELAWASKVVDILKGEQFQPEYLALNPNAVVPTLVHDGNVIIESSVISEYAQDITPGIDLRPVDPVQRARMRMWAKRVDEGFHQACGMLTAGAKNELIRKQIEKSNETVEDYVARIPDPARRERQLAGLKQDPGAPVFTNAIRQCVKVVDAIEEALWEAAYLAGDRYSLADSAITPYLLRLERLGMEKLFLEREHLMRWFSEMKARPSFATAVTAFDSPATINMLMSGGASIWNAASAALSDTGAK